ncbi:MAG: single-stranded DNA-binding protein [Myxococcales bacterium]|nr:single-stranded DNA-binding protein [Myxococcales bacterium]
MRGMNTIFLVGRAGQDPELRTGKSGITWCSLSVATHRNVKNEDGSFDEETDWHDVRLFGEQAEACTQRAVKGSKVAVEGVLAYDIWEDDDGNKRRSPRILGSVFRVVGQPGPRAVEQAAADPEPAQADTADTDSKAA